jgi:hypothetical protein
MALLLITFALACHDPQEDRAKVAERIESGDDADAETRLKRSLERHPDDLELLLLASEFYLRAHAEEYYKPRLSLHYAMRADKAAGYADSRATAAMVRAHRGAGGFAETDALVRQGLAGLNHPDADAPWVVQPVDPDLVEPSLENLREQRRRATAGPDRCEVGFRLVPAGRYPLDDGTTAVVDGPFCVEERGRPVIVSCPTRDLRDCDDVESAVVAGPVAGLLSGAAADHRCCSSLAGGAGELGQRPNP